MDSTSHWIVLAEILRPQGRKGEVLADLFTDFPDRFAARPRVFLASPGLVEASSSPAESTPTALASPLSAEIVAYWLPVGKNAGRIVFHFDGIDTIEQAGELAGKQVIVPYNERVELEPGASYVSDLVGCTVYDRGQAIGLVDSVQFPTSPDGSRRLEEAAPLLAVTSSEGDEILIPFATAFILELNLEGKSIHMALPEGLTQINRSAPAPSH
jgi:16S rRNA processing protein RimM